MARKKKPGFSKSAIELTKGSVILGVGATVGTQVGGPVGGLTAASRFMPAMGAAIGAGGVLEQVKKLPKVSKKKNR